MADVDHLQLALLVLPALPCDVTALRAEGGQLDARLAEVRDGRLSAHVWGLDIQDGEQLLIPVEHRRGGFSIECRITSHMIRGLQSITRVEVVNVARRKPYRDRNRQDVEDIATVSVTAAKRLRAGDELTTRLLDVTADSAAFLTERPLELGDQILITTTVNDRPISTGARVIHASRQAFGRNRIGCEFDTPLDALQA